MSVPLLLGAIADDFTGAADLASMLSSGGVRTALCLDATAVPTAAGGAFQAVVVGLKTRSIPADDARRQSLDALEALRRLEARQVYFKYCSTFDSSAEGNIGPVIEALMAAVQAPFAVAVPALPVNGRTQYLGHLFVGDRLLSETHMRDHPVHPMTDSNLVRHLQTQMSGRVGLIPHARVRQGATAIRQHIDELADAGTVVALVDALTDDDLVAIADAVLDHALVTGGSGLGRALAEVWRSRGMLAHRAPATTEQEHGGEVLILAGSCSAVSLRQISELRRTFAGGVQMDVLRLVEDFESEVDRLYQAVRRDTAGAGWALVYSSADAADRARAVAAIREHGVAPAALGRRIEAAHGALAARAVADGPVRHLVVAGGETSGAVAQALGLEALEIAGELDPGVPVMRPITATTAEPTATNGAAARPAAHAGLRTVTFKSGNFGSPDFFSKALHRLGHISNAKHEQ